eukprot:CAMPEP_0185722144 /NCGR_PEP_ID=MMETSP1164-20130828/50968_1 /TAXON_ID=1104430 /ORGANISM="Chrysoreinhardia sp, Strain CCMP2950" /LENGTH=632 /DNA_ID=CAMNT_0028389805 /DNA_START=505 /DNA_END=2403 /DNA_ORIENTATION=-
MMPTTITKENLAAIFATHAEDNRERADANNASFAQFATQFATQFVEQFATKLADENRKRDAEADAKYAQLFAMHEETRQRADANDAKVEAQHAALTATLADVTNTTRSTAATVHTLVTEALKRADETDAKVEAQQAAFAAKLDATKAEVTAATCSSATTVQGIVAAAEANVADKLLAATSTAHCEVTASQADIKDSVNAALAATRGHMKKTHSAVVTKTATVLNEKLQDAAADVAAKTGALLDAKIQHIAEDIATKTGALLDEKLKHASDDVATMLKSSADATSKETPTNIIAELLASSTTDVVASLKEVQVEVVERLEASLHTYFDDGPPMGYFSGRPPGRAVYDPFGRAEALNVLAYDDRYSSLSASLKMRDMAAPWVKMNTLDPNVPLDESMADFFAVVGQPFRHLHHHAFYGSYIRRYGHSGEYENLVFTFLENEAKESDFSKTVWSELPTVVLVKGRRFELGFRAQHALGAFLRQLDLAFPVDPESDPVHREFFEATFLTETTFNLSCNGVAPLLATFVTPPEHPRGKPYIPNYKAVRAVLHERTTPSQRLAHMFRLIEDGLVEYQQPHGGHAHRHDRGRYSGRPPDDSDSDVPQHYYSDNDGPQPDYSDNDAAETSSYGDDTSDFG